MPSSYGFSKRKRDEKATFSKKASRYLVDIPRAMPSMATALEEMEASRRPETGYVDLAYASYGFYNTPVIHLIGTIPQGTSVNQRVGKKVALKSLQCRGFLYNGNSATYAWGAYLIVYDKRPNGALPLVTDILVSIDPASFLNDTNSGRFKVLKRGDSMLIGYPYLTDATYPTPMTSKTAEVCCWYLDLKGLPCVFKAAGTGAIADIEEGALYLICVGSNFTSDTSGHMGAAFRLRYVDL